MSTMKPATWVLLGAMLLSAADASAVLSGPVGPGDLGTLNGNSFIIANTHTGLGTSFSDVYTFDITAYSFAAGAILTLSLDYLPRLPGAESALSNLTLSLMDIPDSPSDTPHVYAFDSQTHPSDILSVNALLPMGDYKLVVDGKVAGTKGGSYGGLLLAQAMVPESETWAMMLVGLGLVGLRLRKKDHNEARLIS